MFGFRGSTGSLRFPMSYDFQSEIFDSRGTGRGWKNYSTLEKSLWVSLAFSSLVVIGLVVAVAILGAERGKDNSIPITKPPTTTMYPPWITTTSTTTTTTARTTPTTTTPPPGWNQCLEVECVIAAARVNSAIDNSVEPCENFYQYACGRWVQDNPVPPMNNQWDQINLMQERLLVQVREILTEELNETLHYPASYLLAREFYDACVEQDKAGDEDDTSELAALANRLTGDLGTNLSVLGEILGNIREEIKGNYLFTLHVDLDEKDSTNSLIYLDQPEFNLARELLANGTDELFRDAYIDLVAQVWQIVYPEEENAEEIADKVVHFEITLAKNSAKDEDRLDRTKLYNPHTLENLTEMTPGLILNWQTYLEKVFTGVNESIEDPAEKLNFSDMVYIVRDVTFFKGLNQTFDGMSLVDLSNYVKWRILFDYGNEVNAKLRTLFFEFNQKIQGLILPPQRWKYCTEQTNSFFGMAISFPYIEDYFAEDVVEKALKLVQDIKQIFMEILADTEWIDEETMGNIVNKTEAMTSHLGYPDWIKNSSLLEEYYFRLKLDEPKNHFNNVLQVNKWQSLEDLSEILQKKDPENWLIDPTNIMSFYSPIYNSISFPAAILQNPFYRMPLESLNYGAIGALIGHQITQGFTGRGVQSDADGNLVSWWNETTFETYLEKSECFVKQYENYIVEEVGLPLNGRLTLDANIADNAGLRQAFKAYRRYTQQLPNPEKLLPGMTEFTSEKLFFLSYAQTHCGSYSPPTLRQLVSTGIETPNRFRVRGTLENSLEFAETWNCEIPDRNQTCELW